MPEGFVDVKAKEAWLAIGKSRGHGKYKEKSTLQEVGEKENGVKKQTLFIARLGQPPVETRW